MKERGIEEWMIPVSVFAFPVTSLLCIGVGSLKSFFNYMRYLTNF